MKTRGARDAKNPQRRRRGGNGAQGAPHQFTPAARRIIVDAFMRMVDEQTAGMTAEAKVEHIIHCAEALGRGLRIGRLHGKGGRA